MTPLYETYTTLTKANTLDHKMEVLRTARHLRCQLLPALLREGCILSKARVLEFGAGWGRNLLALRSLGARQLYGVDISPEQVCLAHTLGLDDVTLICPDDDLAEYWANSRFDLVLAMDVLEHLSLPQLERFARSIGSILSPGGVLVVQVPNDLAPLNPVRAGDITHLRAFTCSSLGQFFTLAGVELRFLKGISFPGCGLTYAVRRTVTSALVTPLLRGLALIMYGRTGEQWNDPNLLAIGRNRETV